MEKQKKVIDASVIVKWFVEEENSNKAIKIKDGFLKGDSILIAPDLIISEVINTLRYKQRKEKELIYVNKILWNLGLKLIGINQDIISKTIENSLKYNITIYDALYITVAQVYGAFLITADSELYKVPSVIPLTKD